jgi:hypothetical protein
LFLVKINESDLQESDQNLRKTIKRAIRRPKKEAPAPDSLRGWAKSAVRSRNKS